MILILKFFQRVLNSFEAIFRRGTSTALVAGGSHRSIFQDKCLFVYLLLAEIIFFLPMADDQTLFIFVSTV